MLTSLSLSKPRSTQVTRPTFLTRKWPGELLVPLESNVPICALVGERPAHISHQYVQLTQIISGHHCETTAFKLITSPSSLVVLGYLWLRQHNPQIDWAMGRVTGWGPQCLTVCLRFALAPTLPCEATEPEPTDLTNVPEVYHDLCKVFSKDCVPSTSSAL